MYLQQNVHLNSSNLFLLSSNNKVFLINSNFSYFLTGNREHFPPSPPHMQQALGVFLTDI